MMADLFFALLRFSAWLAPQDPATTFMWLMIGGTALALAAILKVANIIDRMRDEPRVESDADFRRGWGSGSVRPPAPPRGGSGVTPPPPAHHEEVAPFGDVPHLPRGFR